MPSSAALLIYPYFRRSALCLASLVLATTLFGAGGKVSLVIKDASGLRSGPWLSSLESGDRDSRWRPSLEVTFSIDGKSSTRRYQRPIGGDNPLAYFIADDQSPGNFYDRPDGEKYRGHKYGDSLLIKRIRNRVGFFQCDISDLPRDAVITAVRMKAHVEPDEGRSTGGTLAVYRCTKPWTKTSIARDIADYTGELITELKVLDETFVKGSDWWIWDWDAALVAYVQEIVRGESNRRAVST
jgi:hypothetical protein